MVTALRAWVQYAVAVRAYNAHGAGPVSPPVVVRTLEDGEYFLGFSTLLARLFSQTEIDNRRAALMSSLSPPTAPSSPPVGVECSGGAGGTSLYVRWAPPPPAFHNGLLQGYRLTLTRLDDSTGKLQRLLPHPLPPKVYPLPPAHPCARSLHSPLPPPLPRILRCLHQSFSDHREGGGAHPNDEWARGERGRSAGVVQLHGDGGGRDEGGRGRVLA